MRRLPLPGLAAGDHALSPAASRYLARVLRLAIGAELEVFDPGTGAVAIARVIELGRDVARLAVSPPSAATAVEAPTIWVQGYPKGDKLADVVRDATELGATLIVPAIAARSVARPDEAKHDKKQQRLEVVAAEAARQCGRARAPMIAAPMPWGDALAFARASLAEGDPAFVLWERATEPLRPELVPALARGAGVAFAVGPEGGIAEDEIAIAAQHGFVARGLGATILRTETVAAAVLGATLVLRGG